MIVRLILIAVLLLFTGPTTAWAGGPGGAGLPFGPVWQAGAVRGVTLAPIEDLRLGAVGYGTARADTAVSELAEKGATWISVTPFGRMTHLSDSDILHDFEIPVAENEERLRHTIRVAHAAGLKVALIPHLYVMDGAWRGEIELPTEEEWEHWFVAYEGYLLRFARLAAEERVELLSIGVEFKSSTATRVPRWREVIARVRAVYPGPLTYSANWDEAAQVGFWDALDVIAVNAFWPLARKPGDGFAVMQERARQVADDLEDLALVHDRPVLLAEMGTKSAADAALAPWEWPEHCAALRYDEMYQAAAYQAVFEALATRAWFSGLFIWKYFSDPFDETQEAREGFSPRGKWGETVLFNWFTRSWRPADELLWLE